LPVTNTVAYFASSTGTKEKGFITLTPGGKLKKNLFYSALKRRANKSEH
jgi:hypothetical protein